MDAGGTDRMGLNHRGNRYFFQSYTHERESPVKSFLFGDLMAAICARMLGSNAYLFHEQFVVKAAEKGMEFSWHQDSGYVGHPHTPYLSCWCALDDVCEANGTVYMLPYEKAGTREMQKHSQDSSTNDLVGYTGNEPGIPVIAPAGSIAIFSSTTFHRSGFNSTPQMRRIYLPQYSPEPIMRPDGVTNWGLAVPFIRDGERVNFGD
jgi:ectoine hydroxylase-related dioxygenase (phytanoyl-CoA dioxygenase family)